MKKAMIGLVMLGFVAAGCTGSFNMTRKVYNFHRSQADKWTDEIVFLIVTMIPVYSLATMGDALIFNSIEFWTGNNPVTASSDGEQEQRRTITQGEQELILSYSPLTDQISISANTAGGEIPQFILERNALGVIAKDAQNRILYTSNATPEGGIAIYDQTSNLLTEYTAKEVRAMRLRSITN